jgi:hypothetical protein
MDLHPGRLENFSIFDTLNLLLAVKRRKLTRIFRTVTDDQKTFWQLLETGTDIDHREI